MKTNKILLFAASILLALGMVACHESNNDNVGIWDDIIKPSITNPVIDSDGSSVNVITEKTWWWIASVDVNDRIIKPEYSTRSFDKEFITLKAEWITLERIDGNTLKLSAEKNNTNKKRLALIHLQAGDYFATIEVTQEPASPSTVKLLPGTITTTYGAVFSPHPATWTKNRFSYDEQYRISSIIKQYIPVGIDVDLPLSIFSFVYGENTITVTETTSLEFDPDYVPTTKVTKYEVKGNKVYVNDENPIDIDSKGRALTYNQKYDDNGNVIVYDNLAGKNLTVEYDNMNGIFRHVNMPSWFLTTYLNIISYPDCFLYNNAIVAWYTETMDSELPAGNGFKIQYNDHDYPIAVDHQQINITSNGYGHFTVDYVNEEDVRNSMTLEYSNNGVIWEGDTRTINIKTAGNFIFNSFEDDVASVQVVDNKSFILTAKKEGVTKLSITDNEDKITQFYIYVVGDLHGDWIEVENGTTSEIVVSDAKTKEQIISEVNKWKGAVYCFSKTNHTFCVIDKLNESAYNFSIEAKTLTLNYGGITETYNITTNPNSYYSFQLYQDMTDYFKTLYPEAGVEKVTVSKRFSTYRFMYIYTGINGLIYI